MDARARYISTSDPYYTVRYVLRRGTEHKELQEDNGAGDGGAPRDIHCSAT